MTISYNEFMRLVPEETKEYVKNVLSYLYYFINKENKVRDKDDVKEDYRDNYTKMVASCIIALDNTKYKDFLIQRGYKKNFVTEKPSMADSLKEEVFNANIRLFDLYYDESLYKTLLPIDILQKAISIRDKEITKENSNKDPDDFYNSYFGSNKIRIDINSYAEEASRAFKIELEKKIYGKLSYSVIRYIQTAAKIRRVIKVGFIKKEIEENELLKNNEDYLVPISLLLAVYLYDGPSKNAIEEFLNKEGVTYESIEKQIKPSYIEKEIIKADMIEGSIQEYYLRYIKDGFNKGKSEETITILNILNNVIIRSFTNSIAIEALLNSLNKSLSVLYKLETTISDNSFESKEKIENDYEELFKDAQKDTKEFIEFCCKTYQLLIEKTKDKDCNAELIKGYDDEDTLAIYIAAHFYNATIDKFFESKGVTFEKVMELLGLKINYEEINNIKIDKSVLLERFKRYFVSGTNQNKQKSQITILDIIVNLCDRDFNKSTIMEDIFEEINRREKLGKNFAKQILNFMSRTAMENNRKKYEDYFKDTPIENIQFLTNLSIIFKNYLNSDMIDKHGINNCRVLAIIGALFSIDDNRLNKYLEDLGLKESEISNAVNGNYSKKFYKTTGYELDIDILVEYFNDYIYEGFNKNIKKQDIHVLDIFFNAFNRDIYNSVFLDKLFSDIKFDASKFFSGEAQNEYFDAMKREDLIEKITTELKSISNNYYNTIIRAINFYDTYSNDLQGENLEIASLLLAFLEKNNSESNINFFIKRGINRRAVIEYFKLNNKSLVSSKKIPEIYSILQKYNSNSLNELLLKIINTETFKVFAESLNIPLNELIIEITTGADYEKSLTITQRMNMLDSLKVEELKNMDFVSLSNYSYPLTFHSSFIQKEYPNAIINNSGSEATEKIKELIEKMYVEPEQPKNKNSFSPIVKIGFLKNILQVLPFYKASPTPVKKEIKINEQTLNDLALASSTLIQKLDVEAIRFQEIEDYMIKYKKKLEEYHQKALEYLKGLEEGTIVLESKGDSTIDAMELLSYKNTLKRKMADLKLSISLINSQIETLIKAKENLAIIKNKLILYQQTLLPFISAGAIINNGLKIQSEGLEISKKMLELFINIWNNNAAETIQILDSLNDTGLSSEQIDEIKKNYQEIIDVESSEIIDLGEDVPILKLTANKEDE